MTTQGAGFCKAERTGKNGNIISPKGSGHNNGGTQVSELSSHEQIQERDLSEDEVVAELSEDGSATIREIEEEDNVVSVSVDRLNNSRLNRFFTEEELSSLRQKEEIVEGEDKPDIDQVWSEIEELVSAHNESVARKRRAKEVRRAKEELKKGTKYDREVSDLSGEEFKELIAEANENPNSDPKSEELEAAIQQINEKYAPMLGESESEPEINQPQIEELEEGTEAWKEIGGYWEELANDVEASSKLPSTEITSLSDGETKLVKTSYDELKSQLKQVDENPDKDGKIVEKNGDVITARVSEGDKF